MNVCAAVFFGSTHLQWHRCVCTLQFCIPRYIALGPSEGPVLKDKEEVALYSSNPRGSAVRALIAQKAILRHNEGFRRCWAQVVEDLIDCQQQGDEDGVEHNKGCLRRSLENWTRVTPTFPFL